MVEGCRRDQVDIDLLRADLNRDGLSSTEDRFEAAIARELVHSGVFDGRCTRGQAFAGVGRIRDIHSKGGFVAGELQLPGSGVDGCCYTGGSDLAIQLGHGLALP